MLKEVNLNPEAVPETKFDVDEDFADTQDEYIDMSVFDVMPGMPSLASVPQPPSTGNPPRPITENTADVSCPAVG